MVTLMIYLYDNVSYSSLWTSWVVFLLSALSLIAVSLQEVIDMWLYKYANHGCFAPATVFNIQMRL